MSLHREARLYSDADRRVRRVARKYPMQVEVLGAVDRKPDPNSDPSLIFEVLPTGVWWLNVRLNGTLSTLVSGTWDEDGPKVIR
jgi:hypothetical protein